MAPTYAHAKPTTRVGVRVAVGFAAFALGVVGVGLVAGAPTGSKNLVAYGLADTRSSDDGPQANEHVSAIPDMGTGPSSASPEDAMALAIASGVPVEDRSQRTSFTAMYALPDGEWALAQSSAIEFVEVASVTGDGSSWEPVDAGLEADGDRLRPGLVVGDATYAAGGVADPVLASFTAAESRVKVELLWQGLLPTGIVEGARATYPGVADDVDLVVESKTDGFEIYLIAHSHRGLEVAGDIPLTYRVEDGTFASRPAGGISVLDPDGAEVAVIPEPRGWDATQDATTAWPVLDHLGATPGAAGTPVDSLDVLLDAAIAMTDQTLTYHLTVPPEWLEREDLVFPVVIDPTYQTLPSVLISFDTMVANGTTLDMSGYAELNLGTPNSGSNVYLPYMTFSIVPVLDKSMISATLQLWNYHSWSCSARSWSVYRANTATTATRWDSQPYVAPSPVISPTGTLGYSSSCNDGWVYADLTEHVKVWLDAPGSTYGSIALSTSWTDNYSWKRFNSANASSNQPRVVFVVNRPPAAPVATISVDGDPLQTVTAGANLTSIDLMASAPVAGNDDDGDTLALAVSVERNGNVMVDKRPGALVGSGNATFDLEPYLAYGGEYKVTFYFWDGREFSPASTPALEFSIEAPAPGLDYSTGGDTWSQTALTRGVRREG